MAEPTIPIKELFNWYLIGKLDFECDKECVRNRETSVKLLGVLVKDKKTVTKDYCYDNICPILLLVYNMHTGCAKNRCHPFEDY